jgi:RNA polymerase sigma-70 factor, ECF subfamily
MRSVRGSAGRIRPSRGWPVWAKRGPGPGSSVAEVKIRTSESGLDAERLPEHLDRLYRAAWAMCGSAYDAEDLVQETVVRVLAKRRVLCRDDPLPYLTRALRNTYLTGVRTASRRPRTVELRAVDSSRLAAISQLDVTVEQRAALDAIATLPEDFRAALVAVDIVGLSYREAGHALQTREATITTRLFRARRRVAHVLQAETAGSTDT